MALTESQIKELKSQLLKQVQHLPPQQKKAAQAQIESMSPEALESMLKQQRSESQRIFRAIINKEIPSIEIGENPQAIAVLSTKAISKGHTIIIPKNPITDTKKIPKEIHSFSEEISKKLIESLKAKSTSVISEFSFGEIILNVIPIYNKNLDLNSERTDYQIKDLEKIKKEVEVEKIKKIPKKIKIEKKKSQKVIKLKRRVP